MMKPSSRLMIALLCFSFGVALTGTLQRIRSVPEIAQEKWSTAGSVAGVIPIPDLATGSVKMFQASELLTIETSPSTTTTMQVPAGATIWDVSIREKVAVPGATTFNVTIGGRAVSTEVAPFFNTAPQGITITPNVVPQNNDGRVRVSVIYSIV